MFAPGAGQFSVPLRLQGALGDKLSKAAVNQLVEEAEQLKAKVGASPLFMPILPTHTPLRMPLYRFTYAEPQRRNPLPGMKHCATASRLRQCFLRAYNSFNTTSVFTSNAHRRQT